MNVARKVLDNTVEAVVGTLVAVISVSVLLSVIYRYVLSQALSWADELPSFLFLWVVFLGAALGVKRASHFEISAFVTALPASVRSTLKYVSMATQAALAAFLVIYGWELVDLTKDNRSPALDIPLAFVYVSVPISGVLMILYLIPQFLAHMRRDSSPRGGE